MGKKKSSKDNKSDKDESKSDKTTNSSNKHSNKKPSVSSRKSQPVSISGSTLFLIGLGIVAMLGAVIVMNRDVQNYLVSLTPAGSNPLEHILANERKSESTGKNSASTEQGQVNINKRDESKKSPSEETGNNDNANFNVEESSEDKLGKSKLKDDKEVHEKIDSKESIKKNGESEESFGKTSDSNADEDDEVENKTEKQKKKVKRKDYLKHEITNKADFKIRKKLDAAETVREEGKLKEALNKFDTLLQSYPESPRALFGKALVTDSLAEKQRSNKLLEGAIEQMNTALRLPDTPKQLRIDIAQKLADRQSFRGWEGKAASTWRYLMDRYPDEILFAQKYGTCLLILSKNDRAREVFKKILNKHPDDSYSLLHLGFILKVADTNYEEAIPLLQRGIDLDVEGKTEGKFFYHLGDAYLRTNQSEKAAAVYKQGAERGLFLSQYQRSLYNADTPLTGRPWWTQEQTTYQGHLKMLEKNWKTIREEGLAQLNPKTGSFLPEEENLRETGDWKQFTLFQRGRKNEENCKKVPKTCALLDRIPDATGCSRGQIKYSVMHPGVHVWPHTGPTNCRIRAHLGLKIPPGPRIRVGNDTRTWIEGKFIIFDDSFEHEVWHDGSELRLVLIVDFWHPELTEHEKRTLSPI